MVGSRCEWLISLTLRKGIKFADFSDLMPLSETHHHLSVPSETVAHHRCDNSMAKFRHKHNLVS